MCFSEKLSLGRMRWRRWVAAQTEHCLPDGSPGPPQGAPSRAGGPPVGMMLRSSLQKKGARARFCTGPLTDVQSGPPNDPSSPAHAQENADCVTGTQASMRSRSLPQRSSRMGTPGPLRGTGHRNRGGIKWLTVLTGNGQPSF